MGKTVKKQVKEISEEFELEDASEISEDVKSSKHTKESKKEKSDEETEGEDDENIKDIKDKEDEKDNNEEDNIDDNETLKANVTEYLKIDDAIREKKEEIKELIDKKYQYEEYLTKYLENANKSKIETNDGEIIFKKLSSKAPLKEDLVEKAIVKKFQDTKKVTESGIKIAHDILEEVNNMRGIKIKSNIRRIKKKERKGKK